MQKILHILFATIFICSTSLVGMKRNALNIETTKEDQAQGESTLLVPSEIIACLAGLCQPKEKNTLMRLNKNFCICLKNRKLIHEQNLSTIGRADKQEDLFTYTYANDILRMKYLLDHDVNVNYKNVLDMTLFHVASANGNAEAMQLLIDYGADVNIPKLAVQPFHEAIYKNDENLVAQLLALKTSPNLELVISLTYAFPSSKNIITPLYIAAQKGHANLVALLLKAGANMNRSYKEETPLFIASENGYTNVVELLLNDNQVKVDEINRHNQMTALHTASAKGYTEIVQLLINKQANVHAATTSGSTPLSLAASYGNIEIVQLLLKNGADIATLTKEKLKVLLTTVAYNGFIEIVELLLNNGTHVDTVSDVGWSALCAATYKNHLKIVELLLKNGANMQIALINDYTSDSLIKKGDTALDIAQKKDYIEIAELLKEHLQKEKKSQ